MVTTSSIAAQNDALIKAKANGTATSKTETGATADSKTLSGDLTFFLKMLTTQLKQQDPSQPMDVNQMTQQIATLSSVQQQVNTNKNLEKLLAQGQTSQLSTAVSYIGNEIETKGSTGQVVSGQGAFVYLLPKAATSTKVTIKNASGSTVFEGTGTNKSGRNIMVWDGVNSANGKKEPDGTYTLSVEAKDSKGKAITPELRTVGIVGGVQNDSTGTSLTIGDTTVKYSDILAVRVPTRANLTSTSGGAS